MDLFHTVYAKVLSDGICVGNTGDDLRPQGPHQNYLHFLVIHQRGCDKR